MQSTATNKRTVRSAATARQQRRCILNMSRRKCAAMQTPRLKQKSKSRSKSRSRSKLTFKQRQQGGNGQQQHQYVRVTGPTADAIAMNAPLVHARLHAAANAAGDNAVMRP